MVGSACVKSLKDSGYLNLITATSKELNLRNKNKVFQFLKNERPDVIINAAAKVGGIVANNSKPYNFLLENLEIQNNLISSSNELNISKFIFLGSSCIYPKFSKQPIKEDYLLTGPLEPTNQWYAIAKISGIKLIESIRQQFNRNYISLMPTNLYGPRDNFDLETSHVLPALLRKFHEAKSNNMESVELWGSGNPKREFMYVEDLADAVKFSIENNLPDSIYNVGTGHEIKIKELASIIKNIVGFDGQILWDESKPDGTPRKLMDSSKLMNHGWNFKTDLIQGIHKTYNWYLNNLKFIKKNKF